MPLPLIHMMGAIVGWISYFSDPKLGRRIRNNLLTVGIASSTAEYQKLVRQTAKETGKGLVEAFAIWFRSTAGVLRLVRSCQGWEHVETAQANNKGIIFLTPHLGCFEITAVYYAARHPMSVLYRPPRKNWLAPLIDEGRKRDGMKMAPTNMSGVRSLLRSLKKGEAVGILPDQVPEFGEGVWADFFGKPAYTMTLVGKLAESTDATVLLAFGERLSWGRGYIIHIEPLNAAPTPENINLGIEKLIRRCPSQYLWSYRRFKQPQPHRQKKDPETSTNSPTISANQTADSNKQ